MFASMDRDERRVVTTQLVECVDTREFVLSKVLADDPEVLSDVAYTHVSTFPTKSQLQRVGNRLLTSQNPIAKLSAQNHENSCESQLRLQTWRLVYEDGAIGYEPLTESVEVQP